MVSVEPQFSLYSVKFIDSIRDPLGKFIDSIRDPSGVICFY